MMFLKLILSVLAFVISGGSVFTDGFRRHRFLKAVAAVIALLGGTYLLNDVWHDLEMVKSVSVHFSTSNRVAVPEEMRVWVEVSKFAPFRKISKATFNSETSRAFLYAEKEWRTIDFGKDLRTRRWTNDYIQEFSSDARCALRYKGPDSYEVIETNDYKTLWSLSIAAPVNEKRYKLEKIALANNCKKIAAVFQETENPETKCIREEQKKQQQKLYEPGCRLAVIYSLDQKEVKPSPTERLLFNNQMLTSVHFYQNSEGFAVAGFSGVVEFTDAKSGYSSSTPRFPFLIEEFALSPSNTNVFVLSGSKLYNLRTDGSQPLFQVFAGFGVNSHVSYSASGSKILLYNESSVRVFNAINGNELSSFYTDKKFIFATFETGSANIISGDEKGCIQKWNSSNGMLLATLCEFADGELLAYDNINRFYATADADKYISVFARKKGFLWNTTSEEDYSEAIKERYQLVRVNSPTDIFAQKH